MYFTKSVAVAILASAPSAFSQSQSTGSTGVQMISGTSQNGVATSQLGANDNLQFMPNMMTVNQGDNMTFQFMSAAHGVMSTSLSAPNVADNQVYSGIIPVDNQTPQPTGKNLPKRKLRIRGAGPIGYVMEEARGLANLLGGGKAGAGANAGNAGAAGGAAGAATQALAAQGKLTVQNSGQAGPATFTVQMNTVGMQAFVCPAAQHAANGMIMMVNVLPQGASNQKRQSSDEQLNAAFQQYLQQGSQTKTQIPTANPGTGGTLDAVAQSVARSQNAKNNNAPTGAQQGLTGASTAGN